MDIEAMETLADPTYPISATHKTPLGLVTWLSFLPQITPSNEPDRSFRECFCCGFSSDITTEMLEDSIVRLPCDCRWRRGCLEQFLSPDYNNEDSCPRCEFPLFEPFSLDAWIETFKSPNATELGTGEERISCGICTMEYADSLHTAAAESEHCDNPVKISCGHIFGRGCLQNWLSPHKGKGNTCPLCRHKLFNPWPSASRGDQSADVPFEVEPPRWWESYDIADLTVADLEWLRPIRNDLRREAFLRVPGAASQLARVEEQVNHLRRLRYVNGITYSNAHYDRSQ